MAETGRKRETIRIPSQQETKACVKIIREWLTRQSHLPQNISEDDVLLFLHCSRYSTEQTKKLIETHYTFRTNTDIFHKRNIHSEQCKQALQVMNFVQLDGVTPDGERVLLFKLKDKNPQIFDYFEMNKYAFAILDAYVREVNCQPGYHMIYDTQDVSLNHILKMMLHLSLIRKKTAYVQESLPFLLMGVHVINSSAILDQLLAYIKPLLKSEILDLVHFYSAEEMNKLYKFIPKKILPEDYGGEGPSVAELSEKTKKILERNEDYILLKETQVVDETKRVKKSFSDFNIMQGSFKNLVLD